MGYFPVTEHLALEGGATNTGFILGLGGPARTQMSILSVWCYLHFSATTRPLSPHLTLPTGSAAVGDTIRCRRLLDNNELSFYTSHQCYNEAAGNQMTLV